MTKQAIGFFDSGIGGLTVLAEAQKLLPNENFIYIADSKYAPYGEKSIEFIIKRSMLIMQTLVAMDVKAVVTACNTATSYGVETLRNNFDLPIIGMEPGIKPAVISSVNKKIGVMATSGTINSQRYKNLVKGLSVEYGSEIISQPCPGLVAEIETGNISSPFIIKTIEKFVQPLVSAGVDTIVLGCTHYPIVKNIIQQIAGDSINILDTSKAVSKQLKSKISLNTVNTNGSSLTKYFSTLDINSFDSKHDFKFIEIE